MSERRIISHISQVRKLERAMRDQWQMREDIVNLAPRCPWVGRIPDASEFDQIYVPYAATTLPEPEAGERGNG